MGNTPLDRLRQTTTLCRITATTFGISKVDRAASSPGTKVFASILPAIDGYHKEVVRAQAEARSSLVEFSVAYGDEVAWRIIPYSLLHDFISTFKIAKQRYTVATNMIFTAVMPKMEDGTPMATEYDPNEIISAYSLDFMFNDYPVGVFEGAGQWQASLAKRFAAQMDGVVASVRAEAVKRLTVPLNHLMTRARFAGERATALDAGVNIGKLGVLRDSSLTSVQQMIKQLHHFNVTDDPAITRMVEMCEPLMGMSPDDLRTDAAARASVIGIGQRVLAEAVTIGG